MRTVCLRALLVWAVVCASGSQAAAGPRSLAEIRDSGVLVMLAAPGQDNEFIHPRGGTSATVMMGGEDDFAGVDVDLMAGLAARLGVRLEIRAAVMPGATEPSLEALIPALLAGEGDVIASSFSITEERSEQVAFSAPYYAGDRVVLVRNGQSGIEEVDDLPGKVAASVKGGSLEAALRELGVTRFHHVPSRSAALAAVATGTADLAMVDLGAHEVLRHESLVEAFRLHEADSYGFAVVPGSELLPQLDAFVEEMALNGTLDRILEHHLELDAYAKSMD